MSDGSSRAVQLMLSMENEKDIECLDDLWMWSVVGILLLSIHHVQEVLDVSEVFIWWNDWLTNSMSVACGGDGWGTSQNSVNVLVPLLLVLVDIGTDVGWVGLGVVGTQRSDQGRHHSHGVSVMSEVLDELFEALVIVRVLHAFLREIFELLLVWKFTIND